MEKNMFDNLTWKCHICGEERPDDKISVHTSPLICRGQSIGDQNVRYCNDKPDCREKVKTFSFIKNDDDK